MRHPLPGRETTKAATPDLLGFPPTLLSSGLALADDSSHRFLGAVASGEGSWHRDIQNTIGILSAEGATLYTGLGGDGASRAIAAFEPAAALPRWIYAPGGLPADPLIVVPDRRAAATGKPHARSVAAILLESKDTRLQSVRLPGHWSHGGLALAKGRVYGEASGAIVALDQATGVPRWRHPLAANAVVRSLAAAPDHLVACISTPRSGRPPVWEGHLDRSVALAALDLSDGKLLWHQPLERPGNLALAGGMVYLANGALHAYGPAERTFRMAVSSDSPADYLLKADAGDEPQPCGPAAAPEAKAAPPPKVAGPFADATTVRLTWGTPLPEMLQTLRTRYQAARGVPLHLSLERLGPERSAWLNPAAGQPFSEEWTKEYAALCAQLAGAARPAFFEVLPEINVYLARNPDHAGAVVELAGALVKAVKQASPNTTALLSFNCEVLTGRYGRGYYRPFGSLTLKQREAVEALKLLAPLTAVVEAIGLTSYPQAVFFKPGELPADYLLSFKAALQKPVLLTRLAVTLDERQGREQLAQAQFLKRLLQNCYWLDAPLVAYPEWRTGAAEAKGGLWLRAGEQDRLALAVWREVLNWKRVPRLTLAGGKDGEEAEEAR